MQHVLQKHTLHTCCKSAQSGPPHSVFSPCTCKNIETNLVIKCHHSIIGCTFEVIYAKPWLQS
jgi:hypothetical protein